MAKAKKKSSVVEAMYDLFMKAPASIAIFEGPDHRVIFANNTYLHIIGKKRSDVVGKTLKELLPDLTETRALRLHDEVFSSGQEFQASEEGFQFQKNGRLHEGYFDYTLRPVVNAEGQIEGIIGFGIEVTEQVKARKVIEENSAQVRTILEGLPQMAWMTDNRGKILFANKGTTSYTGISTEEFLSGKTSLHPEDENARKIWHQHLEDGQAFEVQVRFKETITGNYRWFLVRSNPVHDLQGNVSAWIGTATDIHDQKMFAEELERRVIERTQQLNTANINLERSNAELEHFAFVASHDLQEPLRKIQTFADRLHKSYRDSFPEAASPYLDKIKDASLRMGQLINDVLNFSRVSYAPQHLQTTDLDAVIKAALENYELKEVKVNVEQLPAIQAVTYQMQQLFHNLVSNAWKFRSPGRTLELTITSSELSAEQAASYNFPRTEKKYYEILFKDNGIGFDVEFAEKAFVIFQRLHDPKKYPGTGIGLALCRKIVEYHGGIIFANSVEHEGSTFHIILPENQK